MTTEPIPAILHCPHCRRRHVDEGEWATRVHTTHLCAFCAEEFDISHPQCFGVGQVLASGFVPGPERRVHELKTVPVPFQALVEGIKRFEVRENDRDFREQDVLVLREWDSEKGVYTGRACTRVVTYMLRGPLWGLPQGMCVMSLDDGRVDDLLAYGNQQMEEARAGRRRIAELEHVCDIFVANSAACAEEFEKRMAAEKRIVSAGAEAVAAFRVRLIEELKVLPSCNAHVLAIVECFHPRTRS